MNNAELKLEVVSPTTIKCGHIEWFALDTKLVGKVKALLEENEKLQKDKDRLVEEREDLLSSCLYQDKIIKKAIEYIEDNKSYTTIEKFVKMNTFEKHDEDILDEEMIKELLNILRGEK